MSGREYASETDLKNWSFKPDLGHKGYIELVNLMTDGFQLAAEHTKENVLGGMFIGLPFHFCAQGFRDFRMGGGVIMTGSWNTSLVFRVCCML